MGKVSRENYCVLQGWMITDLELKGHELVIFAVIHGFTQDGENLYTGGLQYLAEWTKATKQTVMSCLKNLVEKGYIEKQEEIRNGVKFCNYRTRSEILPVVKNFDGGGQKILPGVVKNFDPEYKDNTKYKIKEKEKQERERHRYGEYKNVLLTDEDLEKLKNEFPDWQNRIDNLSRYMESTGKTYKSHLATIRNWARRDGEKQKEKYEKMNGGMMVRGSEYYAQAAERLRQMDVERRLKERARNESD